MAAAERKGKKASAECTQDHFKKMLEGPCLNHTYPIKHACKDCRLMKKFLAGGSKKGDWKKKHDPPRNDTEEKDDDQLPNDLRWDGGLHPQTSAEACALRGVCGRAGNAHLPQVV
jgi:hypothetical protein